MATNIGNIPPSGAAAIAGGVAGPCVVVADASENLLASTTLYTDEANSRVGVNNAAPTFDLHVKPVSAAGTAIAGVDFTDGAATSGTLGAYVGGSPRATLTGYGASFTTSGANKANGGRVSNSAAGGLSITASNASGDLRFYTGGFADANLRATISSAGAWTVPAYGVRATVAGSATATLTVSSLVGDTAGSYRLLIYVKNATASDAAIYLRPNGATTNLNCAYNSVNEANTNSIGKDTTWWISNLRASSEAWIVADVLCKTGARRRAVSRGTSSSDSTQINIDHLMAGSWNETATQITSFDIFSSVAVSLAVGSYVEAFRTNMFLG